MTWERDGTWPSTTSSSILSSNGMGRVVVIFVILSDLRPTMWEAPFGFIAPFGVLVHFVRELYFSTEDLRGLLQ